MRKTFVSALWLAVVSILATGCLVKDTTETIYIEPDGSVTWTVLESDVRSDEKLAPARLKEQAEYLAAATAEVHPMALAFSRLSPAEVRTQILRAERPYTVRTVARFARLDVVMEQFAEVMGATATSALDHHDGVVTWTWMVREDSGDAAQADHEAIRPLGDGFEHCRFVLSSGRFVTAEGFDLSDDKRLATIRIPDQSNGTSPPGPLRFLLTWIEAEK